MAALALVTGALISAGPAAADSRDRQVVIQISPGAYDDDDELDEDELPIVIGHRGASGYRPEHTLEAYKLAIELGADFIEPDLVSTKDRVLVARHENEISGTTDVASRTVFADRKRTRTIDGEQLTGWFTEDFTLAELRTLRAVERIPAVRQRNTLYNGRYQVPTFREVLALARSESRRTGREIGVYPETKHPTYFDSITLSLEEPLLADLRRAGYRDEDDPVFIQSFEVANLVELSKVTDIRLVQLFGGEGRPFDFTAKGDKRTYDDLQTPAGFRSIAAYADGVGPNKGRVIPVLPSGALGAPTAFVRNAHAVDLLVHPYTFRNENQYLPAALRKGADPNAYGDAFAEYEAFFKAGVDGLFTDNPDTARIARDSLFGVLYEAAA